MKEPVSAELQKLLKSLDDKDARNGPIGNVPQESSSHSLTLAWLLALGLPALFSVSVYFAFAPSRAGTSEFWLLLTGASVPLALLGIFFYRNSLLKSLKPRQGDLSIGFAMAVSLVLISFAGRSLFAHASTEQHAWLLRIFLQVGPARQLEAAPLVLFQMFLIITAEELIFRGAVFMAWERITNPRTGWMFSAFTYALAMSPTVYQLRVDEAGPNPLLFLAASAAGLIWCFSRKLSHRIGPALVSHLVFTYFMVTQFRPPGL